MGRAGQDGEGLGLLSVKGQDRGWRTPLGVTVCFQLENVTCRQGGLPGGRSQEDARPAER